MSKEQPEGTTLETEIVEEAFKAPVLRDIKYPVKQTDIDALLAKYADIPVIDVNGPADTVNAQYALVLKGHKEFVTARTSIEKIRKELKAPALEYGAKVDSVAKEFQARLGVVEARLLTERTKVEDEQERRKAEAARLERLRIQTIRDKITAIQNIPLAHFNSSSVQLAKVIEGMPEVTEFEYQEFTAEAVAVWEATVAKLQEAWQAKYDTELEAEAERARREQQRIEDEAREQALAEERRTLEAERTRLREEENARLETQRIEDEGREAQRKALEAEQAALQAQQEAFAEEQRKAAEAAALAESQRLEAEARAKQEAKEAKQRKAKHDEALKQTLSDIGAEYTPEALLNAIVAGNIRHVYWEADLSVV